MGIFSKKNQQTPPPPKDGKMPPPPQNGQKNGGQMPPQGGQMPPQGNQQPLRDSRNVSLKLTKSIFSSGTDLKGPAPFFRARFPAL